MKKLEMSDYVKLLYSLRGNAFKSAFAELLSKFLQLLQLGELPPIILSR